MSIRFLNPVQTAEVSPAVLAPRLSSLQGLRIGFLSNSKENADRLLALVAEELKNKFTLSGVVFEKKMNPGTNCPIKILDGLVSQVDAVVTGIGD
ncbi:MAG: hypothetical protein HY787_04745 [Deltaproteobacteria bacterium]|nr:hypothetical protein [Deltaproteobacteria bacterium]